MWEHLRQLLRNQCNLTYLCSQVRFDNLEQRCLFVYTSYPEIASQMVNWINRDRQNPVAAVTRVGTTLNEGLPENYINPSPKHSLRWNDKLAEAASGWADWNFDHRTMQHGTEGSDPYSRAVAVGYQPIHIVENGGLITISYISSDTYVYQKANLIHDLFVAHAGHRAQLFDEDTREVGIAVKTGMWG